MLSERLINELNEQLSYEFFSSNLYLAMAGYCLSIDLNGFGIFFKIQSEEERFHAMKFFDYLNQRDARLKISALGEPKNDYDSILDVFKESLEHERLVSKRIYKLSDIAMEERDHATLSFLKWFIDEQVEEEATIKTVIKKLERIKDDNSALFMLDTELSTRTFTPPPQV